jgi:hypothetical protein
MRDRRGPRFGAIFATGRITVGAGVMLHASGTFGLVAGGSLSLP